jgi:inorganic pyrophosphatase
VEYVSPWPSPFNYGFLVDTIGPDGDPLDAIIVGEALEIGSIVTCNVLAIVRFVDGGSPDDKWICGTAPLTRADLAEIDQFFKRYAKLKRPLHWIRGRRSETAYLGIDQA